MSGTVSHLFSFSISHGESLHERQLGMSILLVWARFEAVRVSLVRLRERLVHISHPESSKGQEPWFPWVTDVAIQVLLSVPFAICKVRGHLGPSQFDKATLRKSFHFNSQDASAHDFFVSYPAHSITVISKNTVSVLDSVMWLSSTSLHLWPLISLQHSLVLKASGKFLWPPKELLSSQASSLAECRS